MSRLERRSGEDRRSTVLLGKEVSPAIVEMLAERAAQLDINLREEWKRLERLGSLGTFQRGMQWQISKTLGELHGRPASLIRSQLRKQVQDEAAA